MPYRGIQLTPKPASELAGDKFPIDLLSGTVMQIRGASVIQTWSVSFPGVLLGDVPPIPEPSATFRWLTYWEERRVPGTNVSITGLRIGSNDAVLFDWSDDTQDEVASMANLAIIADQVDADLTFAKKILMAMAYRKSPDGSNLGSMVGAQVAVNCAANVSDPVVYTAP